mmetsp:Transcript_10132/g.8930  ORF Transcript_10132/g.8930 Transcript_10132/m.8930 type:complete len:122 (+) Transcript_10132:22-387(+)
MNPDSQKETKVADYCGKMIGRAKEINLEFNHQINNNIVNTSNMENFLFESTAYNTLKSKNKLNQWQATKEKEDDNSQNKNLEIMIKELKDYEKVAATLIARLDGIDTSLNKEKEAHGIFKG